MAATDDAGAGDRGMVHDRDEERSGTGPALLGSRCTECGTYAFPAERATAGTPTAARPTFETVELSRRGRIWSYTDARYQPPPPYVAADPYVPFCLAAVELAAEKLVVMGQVVPGVTVDDLTVGDEVELVIDTLYSEDDCDYLVWKWRPVGTGTGPDRRGGLTSVSDDKKVARPRRRHARVGQVGTALRGIRLGRRPRRHGRRRPRLARHAVRLGRRHHPQRLPGLRVRARPSPRRSAGPAPASRACYAACASGAVAIANARAQILAGLCDVALVVGADTTPKGFFAPVGGGERKDDPDWLRFHLMGATNPTYFGLYARRRMDRFGATEEDFAQVKVKNARHGLANPYARYRKEVTVEEVLASPMVADPLRLLEICATSDGGAALVLTSMEFARRHAGGAEPLVTIDAVSTVTPTFPNTVIEMPNFSTDSAAARPARRSAVAAAGFRPSIATAAYAEAGHRPRGRQPGRGLRPLVRPRARLVRGHRPVRRGRGREAAARRRHHHRAAGCRSTPRAASRASARPSRPRPSPRSASASGSSGARATGHQVEGARVAVTANQGLFGHGSSVLLSR